MPEYCEHNEIMDSCKDCKVNKLQELVDRLQRGNNILRSQLATYPCKCVYIGDGDTMTCSRCDALGVDR